MKMEKLPGYCCSAQASRGPPGMTDAACPLPEPVWAD